MTDSNNQLDQIEEVELNQETVEEAIVATESGLETYQSYLTGEFKDSAKAFIYNCGLLSNTLYEDDPITFIKKVNVQLNQVKEELGEILVAIDLDTKEHIDGHVDAMFVGLNFVEMNQYLQFISEDLLQEHLDINKLQLVGNIFDHIIGYPLPETVTDTAMVTAARRIVENNKLKYTTDRDVAYAWRLPAGARKDGIKVQEVVVDGVTYYSLVDKNGKIRKHRDFVAVELSDLTGEG